MENFEDNLKEISILLLKRMTDVKPAVRKYSLQALEWLIILEIKYKIVLFQTSDFIAIHDLCSDESISTRKQALSTLTTCFRCHQSSSDIDSLWLSGIFPLVTDVESTVQVY